MTAHHLVDSESGQFNGCACLQLPVSGSQTRMVESHDPEKSELLTGSNWNTGQPTIVGRQVGMQGR